MHDKIEYIVDEHGKTSGVVLPLSLWEELKSTKAIPRRRKMTRKKLLGYVGTLKLRKDPLKFQREIRREW
ncbi:MAG: hypothetical protein HY961_00110 [Ignavibacteriae bacterium]|nr:hypothetical protein [Ignavibacteriota bacterium]